MLVDGVAWEDSSGIEALYVLSPLPPCRAPLLLGLGRWPGWNARVSLLSNYKGVAAALEAAY